MADHRANDLSYGHLGEATYDADENYWGFSVDTLHSPKFEQILPFTRDQLPSITNALEETEIKSGNATRKQRTWLLKNRPETFPANTISLTYSRSPLSTSADSLVPMGQLLAVGGAVDEFRMPAYRTVPLIAMACGEAGNFLRLLRPRIEHHGWGVQSSVRLSLMDASIAEQGHWAGTGGRIQQIAFADDDKLSSTWLAVRQHSMITFFRPMYHINHIPAITPEIFEASFPPSHINANPVAVLNAEQSGSTGYVDVAFNPYYARQFAVVDEAGAWRIWDIEGRRKLTLNAGKQGTMKDGSMIGSPSNESGISDGWHRIVWATNVSTVVVCDRRSLVVFDITAMPKRLGSHSLLPLNSTDWILDINRSAVNSNHVYVLTSSRIFWLDIVAGGEGKKSSTPGAKLIISYRHYRDPNDYTMKLVVLKDETVSALIISRKSQLINYYKFSMNSTGPTSSQGSLVTSHHTNSVNLQSLLFVQARLMPRLSRAPGSESNYIERGVRFYQAWSLSSNLEMSRTLYAVYDWNSNSSINPMHCVTAPTRKILDAQRPQAVERIRSHFIVADGDLDEHQNSLEALQPAHLYKSRTNTGNPLRLRLNWMDIYRQVFSPQAESSETELFMKHLEKVVLEHVHRRKENIDSPMKTLLELSQLPIFYKDLEQANLDYLLDKILVGEVIDTPFALVLSNLTLCPGSKAFLRDDSKLPNFVQVYDRLVAQWIQNLPREISNQARLAIFNITRKVAVEICLSSIAISCRDKSADQEIVSIEADESALPTSETKQGSKEVSQFLPSSQITAESLYDAGFGLPTPAQTPSLHSGGSVTSTEVAEDYAVLRLRQYAISMESPQVVNNPTLLSYWPSTPGLDPANFRWNPIPQSSMADEEADYKRDRKRRREEARRRRKTEKFLNEDARKAYGPASQPAALASFGSQPQIARHAASSQIIDELPMTQPSRGMFGSRFVEGAKKKQRRRNAGF